MPQPILHVGQPSPFVGVRLKRLGEERQRLREDGRLAAFGLAVGPFDANEVAEIQLLRERPADLADLLLPDHHLHPARPVGELGCLVLGVIGGRLARGELTGPVADVEKVNLAADASTDDASRRLDDRPLVVGHVGRELQDRLDRLLPVEALAPRIDAELLDVAQLVQSTAFYGSIVFFRHGGFDFR